MKALIALATALAVVSLGAGAASGGGSVTYDLQLVSIDPQGSPQDYGIAHYTVRFADGRFHQCCDRVAVVTDCEEQFPVTAFPGARGPAVTLWYTAATPIIGPFYDYTLADPVTCHAHVERLTDHFKLQGPASNEVTFTSP